MSGNEVKYSKKVYTWGFSVLGITSAFAIGLVACNPHAPPSATTLEGDVSHGLSQSHGLVENLSNDGSNVIYGIFPFGTAYQSGLPALKVVDERLMEIHDLGATILWVMPIFTPASEGMGYNTIDYFHVWDKLGTEGDLQKLVADAHQLGMRVILDVPLNHTSTHHPFAQDVIKYGKSSKYYDFYQHNLKDNSEYAKFYHSKILGKTRFVYYFWDDLINLNYSNPAVQEYAASVLEYWIKECDVDGYRLDASWGPASRWPNFYRTMNARVRALKPNAFMLAEDKAGRLEEAEYSESKLQKSGMNAAYDWLNSDPNGISKWSFQVATDLSQTVFNEKDTVKRAHDFVKALSSTKDTGDLLPIRFLENNNTPTFVANHSIEQTQFAAQAIYSLPGIPLIFYGQEVAVQHGVWDLPSFDPHKSMRSYNPKMWDFYQQLLRQRKNSASMVSGSLETVQSAGEVTIIRKSGNQESKVSLNFGTDRFWAE